MHKAVQHNKGLSGTKCQWCWLRNHDVKLRDIMPNKSDTLCLCRAYAMSLGGRYKINNQQIQYIGLQCDKLKEGNT